MADQDQTRSDPTLAQNDDAPTPQDQFKPAESHFGQSGASGATEIGGDKGQQGGSSGEGGPLNFNDQASSQGLGQNQQGYGSSVDAAGQQDVLQRDAAQQASGGQGARTGNLGPSPHDGAAQPASPTTGGPDLSKGLADQNRSGGL